MGIDREKASRARRRFEERREQMTEDDVKEAAEKGAAKIRDLETNVPGVLEDLWEDIKTMAALLRDWCAGDYDKAPWHTITAIAAAIAYLACPVDVIPDVIPGLGFLDDLVVIKICLDLVRQDLETYRQEKESGEAART